MAYKGENTRVDNSLKLIAKTSAYVLIGLFLSKLLTYVYRIIVARSFGPEVYGLLSLATMILGFFVAIASLGLTDGVLRYVSIYRGKKESSKIYYTLKISILVLFFSGLISAAILFFSSGFISEKIFHNVALEVYLQIFSFLIPISLFANLFLYVLRAYERVKAYSFLQNILQNIVKVVFLVLFIILGLKSHNALAFSFFSGTLIMFILAFWLCRSLIPNLIIESKLNESKKREVKVGLFLYSWPIIFSGIIGNIFYWTDSFMIGYFKSVEAVGLYNAAVPIAALLLVTQEIFMQLFYPIITREYSIKNFGVIKELSKQVSKWIFIINLPALLVMLIFPGVIINILFGSEYLVAQNSLRLLALSVFSTSIAGISASLIYMMGKSKLLLFNTVLFSVINVILNSIFIPLYGINGAALATLLSVLGSGILSVFWSHKYLDIIPMRRKMLNIALLNLLLFIPLLFLEKFMIITPINLAITGLIFLALYIYLIFVTRCFDKNDLRILDSIKRKIFSKR